MLCWHVLSMVPSPLESTQVLMQYGGGEGRSEMPVEEQEEDVAWG